MPLQARHRLRELLTLQGVEVLGDRLGRVFQAFAMVSRRRTDFFGGKVKQIRHELVRMLRFDPVYLKRFRGKILEIKRHNGPSSGQNSRGEYMPVVGVWESESCDKAAIPLYQTIGHSLIHEVACAFKLDAGQVRSIGEDSGHPFLVNGRCPPGAKQLCHGEAHQEIPQRGGIEHAGIVDNRKTGHALITHIEFLCLGYQRIQGLYTFRPTALLVRHQVAKEHSSVCADFVMRNLAFFQQTHHIRARDV
jgi:hypothetical protein